MPPQLKTLIPLFGAFILLFLIARHLLLPDSFGKTGHFRLNSIVENQSRPLNYADKKACSECHGDKSTALQSDVHSTLTCEVCHGPASDHIANPGKVKLDLPDQREFCGLCHAYNPSRGKVIQQVDITVHNINHKCVECHNPHAPWEMRN
jgi:DnaJ-class molecular chaperone